VLGANLVVLAICVWYGVIKIDEGWYVVSTRFALHGRVPYNEFAWTQGPVLPYVLAPFQAVASGVTSARVVSASCAGLGIVLTIVTGRRLSGNIGALLTGLFLICLAPTLQYWLAVVKTYGLASLFLAGTVAALTASRRWPLRLPVAVASAILFAATRASGVPLALFVFVFAVVTARERSQRLQVVAVAAVLVIPLTVLLIVGGHRTVFDLVWYHSTRYWTDPSVSGPVHRLRQAVGAWPFATFLGAGCVVAVVTSPVGRRRARAHPEIAVLAAGILGFVAVHVASGAFQATEYLSPLVPSAVMLAIVLLLRSGSNVVLTRVLMAVAFVSALLLTPRAQFLVTNGAPSATARLSRCIETNSRSSDRVFALMMLDAVAGAHRDPMRELSLGVFSYEDVSTALARDEHLLNPELARDAIANPDTSLVVLSNVDRELLARAGWFSKRPVDRTPIDKVLATDYHPVCTAHLVREWHNIPVDVTVYARDAPEQTNRVEAGVSVGRKN
jgi:hypothetical protein